MHKGTAITIGIIATIIAVGMWGSEQVDRARVTRYDPPPTTMSYRSDTTIQWKASLPSGERTVEEWGVESLAALDRWMNFYNDVAVAAELEDAELLVASCVGMLGVPQETVGTLRFPGGWTEWDRKVETWGRVMDLALDSCITFGQTGDVTFLISFTERIQRAGMIIDEMNQLLERRVG